MPIYYLNARPETIFSLVTTGKTPENLPDYIKTKDLKLYSSLENAEKKIETPKKQAFILVLNAPTFTKCNSLAQVEDKQEKEEYFIAEWIEPSWIQKIVLYQKNARSLLNRYFNGNCPIEIEEISSDLISTSSSQISYEEQIITLPQQNIVYRKKGDLLGSKMQALINTVNCVGVMGKGIAFAFKQRYPDMFKEYQARCKRGAVKIGEPYVYQSGNRKIINFPTKKHWKNPSQIAYVEEGLQYLAAHLKEWGITSMAIPPLGCGNGGLNWKDVQPLIEKYLTPTGVHLEIYLPTFDKEEKPTSKPSFFKASEQQDKKIASNLKQASSSSKVRFSPY